MCEAASGGEGRDPGSWEGPRGQGEEQGRCQQLAMPRTNQRGPVLTSSLPPGGLSTAGAVPRGGHGGQGPLCSGDNGWGAPGQLAGSSRAPPPGAPTPPARARPRARSPQPAGPLSGTRGSHGCCLGLHERWGWWGTRAPAGTPQAALPLAGCRGRGILPDSPASLAEGTEVLALPGQKHRQAPGTQREQTAQPGASVLPDPSPGQHWLHWKRPQAPGHGLWQDTVAKHDLTALPPGQPSRLEAAPMPIIITLRVHAVPPAPSQKPPEGHGHRLRPPRVCAPLGRAEG